MPSPIFVHTYDLLQWLIPCTLQFPRSQRGVLARQLQTEAFALHAALVDAALCNAPGEAAQQATELRRADAALIRLRTCIRLSYELKLLAPRQYEFVSQQLAEIGRLLGSWLKKARKAARAEMTGKPDELGKPAEPGAPELP